MNLKNNDAFRDDTCNVRRHRDDGIGKAFVSLGASRVGIEALQSDDDATATLGFDQATRALLDAYEHAAAECSAIVGRRERCNAVDAEKAEVIEAIPQVDQDAIVEGLLAYIAHKAVRA